MKDWIKRWLNTEQPSKRDFEELAAAAVTSLAEAQKAHIADLRILIDKGHEREAQLAKMVELAMEHQFYRPAINGTRPDNKISAAISPDHLQDVAVFDEKADAALSKEQEEAFAELVREQNEKGLHKVEAA